MWQGVFIRKKVGSRFGRKANAVFAFENRSIRPANEKVEKLSWHRLKSRVSGKRIVKYFRLYAKATIADARTGHAHCIECPFRAEVIKFTKACFPRTRVDNITVPLDP